MSAQAHWDMVIPRKTYLNFRNGLSLIYKHLGPGELIYKLPLKDLFGLGCGRSLCHRA